MSRQTRRYAERHQKDEDFNVRFPYGYDAIAAADLRALGRLTVTTIDGRRGFSLPAPFADLRLEHREVLTIAKAARLKSALAFFKVHPVVTPKE